MDESRRVKTVILNFIKINYPLKYNIKIKFFFFFLCCLWDVDQRLSPKGVTGC